MSSDPERQGDAYVPEHVIPRPPEREYVPGGAFARSVLATALERGDAIGTGPEAAAAMREALRDVWALAEYWQRGTGGLSHAAAAARLREAISGRRDD